MVVFSNKFEKDAFVQNVWPTFEMGGRYVSEVFVIVSSVGDEFPQIFYPHLLRVTLRGDGPSGPTPKVVVWFVVFFESRTEA